MTGAAADTLDDEPVDVAAFRQEAREWLASVAGPRTQGSTAFKRQMVGGAASAHGDAEVAALAREWQRRIYEAGFAGVAVPVEYGGLGLTTAHDRAWRQELARYEIDLLGAGIGLGMVLPTLLAHGTEEQKHLHASHMLRGERLWCQLFSEPGAGSDLAGLSTRAERDGDEWVINGQKVWNSYAHVADWGMLLARTNWDVPKHRGITYFLLDMRSPGVEARPLRQATGEAHFNETFFTDVRVPHENVVGGVDNGWAVAQTTLMHERSAIGASPGLGVGFDDWLQLARACGRTSDPDIRQRLAQLYTRLSILKWLAQRAQAAQRTGKAPGPESSVAKLASSINFALSCDLALAIEGASGMIVGERAPEDGFWQHYFLGQWSPRIGGGTEQIQRNIIGERVLGLPGEPRTDTAVPFRDVPRN
jgi:alkylation response protein AidB-like acyl-CoA dehydrogenase